MLQYFCQILSGLWVKITESWYKQQLEYKCWRMLYLKYCQSFTSQSRGNTFFHWTSLQWSSPKTFSTEWIYTWNIYVYEIEKYTDHFYHVDKQTHRQTWMNALLLSTLVIIIRQFVKYCNVARIKRWRRLFGSWHCVELGIRCQMSNWRVN